MTTKLAAWTNRENSWAPRENWSRNMSTEQSLQGLPYRLVIVHNEHGEGFLGQGAVSSLKRVLTNGWSMPFAHHTNTGTVDGLEKLYLLRIESFITHHVSGCPPARA